MRRKLQHKLVLCKLGYCRQELKLCQNGTVLTEGNGGSSLKVCTTFFWDLVRTSVRSVHPVLYYIAFFQECHAST